MSKLRKIKIDDQSYLYGIKKGFDHEARNELVSFRGYLDGFKTSPFVVEFNGAQNPRIIGVYIHLEGTTNAYEPNVAKKFIEFALSQGWDPKNDRKTTVFRNGEEFLDCV